MPADLSGQLCPECEDCILAYAHDEWGDRDGLWCPWCKAEFDTDDCSQNGGDDE